MKKLKKQNTFVTGLAIFSMLFGAGNVIYPLVSGQLAKDQYIFALIGFLTSSVAFAFIGLLSMVLFEGNYLKFFSRLGKVPGFLLTLFIMCIVGPLGAIPRIITVSYGSIRPFIGNIPLVYFSLFACTVMFLLTLKRKRLLDIIGYVLTPMLLSSLLLIIIAGFWNTAEILPSSHGPGKALIKGFLHGNQTMDLLGALCFSSIVFKILKRKKENNTLNEKKENKKIFLQTLKAGSIGLLLLALIYIGFIRLSAFYGHNLSGIQSVEVLGALTTQILGAKATLISSLAVSLACLTTAIALSAVFTDFIYERVFLKKVRYSFCLIGSLLVTFLFSTLNFEGIMGILGPILQVCYPALIVLSVLNIAHKLFGFKMVKTPVFLTFGISLLFQLI